jgi:hypothetical protein
VVCAEAEAAMTRENSPETTARQIAGQPQSIIEELRQSAFAAEHIEQLRQFLKARIAQKLPHSRELTRPRPSTIHSRGAEVEQHLAPAASSNATPPVQHGTSAVPLDRYSNEGHERQRKKKEYATDNPFTASPPGRTGSLKWQQDRIAPSFDCGWHLLSICHLLRNVSYLSIVINLKGTSS